MTAPGRHRTAYADRTRFLEDVYSAGLTAGALIATLERCGLRPRDLARALGLPPDTDPDWADGRAPISVAAVEMIVRIDGVRRDLRDGLVARHRGSRGPVTLTIHRTNRDARRAFLAADAYRAYHTDRLVPDFAAVHRVASIEACDRLVALGVFAVVAFSDDPNDNGDNHVRDHDLTTTGAGGDCPFGDDD